MPHAVLAPLTGKLADKTVSLINLSSINLVFGSLCIPESQTPCHLWIMSQWVWLSPRGTNIPSSSEAISKYLPVESTYFNMRMHGKLQRVTARDSICDTQIL